MVSVWHPAAATKPFTSGTHSPVAPLPPTPAIATGSAQSHGPRMGKLLPPVRGIKQCRCGKYSASLISGIITAYSQISSILVYYRGNTEKEQKQWNLKEQYPIMATLMRITRRPKSVFGSHSM